MQLLCLTKSPCPSMSTIVSFLILFLFLVLSFFKLVCTVESIVFILLFIGGACLACRIFIKSVCIHVFSKQPEEWSVGVWVFLASGFEWVAEWWMTFSCYNPCCFLLVHYFALHTFWVCGFTRILSSGILQEHQVGPCYEHTELSSFNPLYEFSIICLDIVFFSRISTKLVCFWILLLIHWLSFALSVSIAKTPSASSKEYHFGRS